MTVDERQVERLRPTPMLLTAAAVLAASVVLFTVNYAEQRTQVVWGWMPAMVGTAVAGWECWRTASVPDLDRVTARVWRSFAGASVILVLAITGDARHYVLDPGALGQDHDLPTSIAYGAAVLLLLWALLRLPMSGYQRDRLMLRFVLDSATVTITLGVFSWYLITEVLDAWQAGSTRAVPMLILTGMGLVAALAFVKVAVSGFGGLDRVALRLLALAAAIGAAGGGLVPLFLTLHPGLSGSMVFIPAAMLCVALAADRQRRAARVELPPRRPRSFNAVPYLAVAATDGLLLFVAGMAGAVVLTVALAAVVLTVLVVARQISALSENGRLLRRVDANLLELNSYQDQLTHRATHDDLTDLANRSLFEQQTSEALARVSGPDGDAPETLSLALIDLDDFKAINDRLGHAVGDALLVVVADRLREAVRADDIVARLGGDEFGLLLNGLRSDEATEVLDRIAESLTRPVHALGYDLLVKASIGLAEVWPEASPQELLRRADLAMYAAKERGKGRHAVYDARLEQDQAADAQLGAELRRALDHGDFTLVYQPIVALPDGRWTSLETLVRWKHAERGFIGPDVFIPIAERTGLIVPLGDWILRTALRQAADWQERFGTAAPGEIGVNVSARQLREPGFAADVRAALADSGFDPEKLVVEVTETAVFDGGVALDTLQNLVTLGVKVALDDFGTGHSSLGLLRTCPADTLKVDKSFVDGIGGRSEEAVIATAMIQITNGLHLQAIAEGVETAEQAETLYRLGYRFAQGYHFSRPLSAEQVDEQLRAHRPLTV
ncbi:hypothetical protein Asp14428_70330 [Actinoplanes sp. NBRC 14428]|uniref:Diguanylate cyclase (GGDEF)-like protein n=1 Tax=Pseudosporangium ferrugineum TaxID=439699 RepID=A0A2T0S2P2_9ACTN|nr:bifunctional diguanylate cyclase/phosphodiesterase [Pseudosporangium ferrugineum]PRY27672.1 diguanylate cyclase (GGDEF)-like protein [Pseudosporangium ferrugineum]BCJ55558.1 hypothetical protein Asp14428_70330 [Actinoplanes sp. NBRC 14428]